MTTAFKIDTNVPMPEGLVRVKYPFSKMEIGESFFVPGIAEGRRVAGRAQHHAPKKFAGRTVTENGITGIRYWRIA